MRARHIDGAIYDGVVKMLLEWEAEEVNLRGCGGRPSKSVLVMAK